MRSANPVAVITGAASGIGAATALYLRGQGMQVICLDIDAARLDEFMHVLGDGHLGFTVDVCDESGMQRVFREIATRCGRIDALATCAGIVDTTAFSALTSATLRHLFEVNVVATFSAVQLAVPLMGSGARICTVSSVAGIRGGGLAGTLGYATSKGAVITLTKGLARELGPQGITVNCVAPAVIRTPMLDVTTDSADTLQRLHRMTALGREGSAEEAAQVIGWLLSDHASFVSGVTLAVDGGVSML